jgi:hypothetical protein
MSDGRSIRRPLDPPAARSAGRSIRRPLDPSGRRPFMPKA